MTEVTKRRKIAILGGGMSALTTAFELTNPITQPNWKDRYDITVYQQGWRLGGKGASGRGRYDRIEEHGLHIWLGFYENAFRLMQQAYQELGRSPGTPLAAWEDAFKPHSYVVLGERVNDRWTVWPFDFPIDGSRPGTGGELPSLWDYIVLMLDGMEKQLAASRYSKQATAHAVLERVARDMEIEWEQGVRTLGATLLHVAHALARKLPRDPHEHQPEHHSALIEMLEKLMVWAEHTMEERIEEDDTRRLFILLDLGSTIVRGLIRDCVFSHSLDILDEYEFRDWLKKHGASEKTCWSSLLKGMYDLAFAYQNGERDRPNIAAGTGLRSILRLCFTYKGAIFWKMQAGMGDTIFTPLYQLLKERGVQIKFFHSVNKLELSADKRSIARIQVGRQATLKQEPYDPLVDVDGLLCWPSTPRYEQLTEGEELEAQGINLESFWSPWKTREQRVTLEVGKDFDIVLLGISLGSLPHICDELIDANDKWQAMVQHVETVRTMAVQLWLKSDLQTLGWPLQSPVMDAYVDPLNTWADMSHLLDRESWPPAYEPLNIAYYCGPMEGGIPPVTDENAPVVEQDSVKLIALEWLRRNSGALWPAAALPTDPHGLNWDLLVDPDNGSGEQRFDSQFWRANVDPSERYVLSVAGSTKYRLKTDASGFDNLYLTGDWIHNGLNVGCIESAVISGMQASHAISGYPQLEEIIGGSHP